MPAEVAEYLAGQLEIADASCLKLYGERDGTARTHAGEIQEAEGWRDFAEVREELVAWLDARAWTTGDGPKALFDAAAGWLREGRVLLPGASRLARLDAYPDGYPRLRIPVGKTYTERMVPLHPQAADALRELIDAAKAANAAARHDAWAQRPVRYVFMRRGKPMGRHFLFADALEIACRKAGLVDGDGNPTVTPHRFRHTVGTQLAEGGAQTQTIMAILGHRNAQMSATYSHVSDPVLKQQYEKVIAAGGRIAGPAAEELLSSRIGEDTLNWLKTNFFKTELELGHCLRAPAEGPCECDIYLRCSKFLTTSEYASRLRSRLAREQQLAQDAIERGWPREVERHNAIADQIRCLLADLGASIETGPDDHC
ncbi:Tyrosine recombinase XerD [Streptomyces sp. MP131-18]|nr:Tyrosine recombinase XerD [Streptomyces sp. MP131-18]